MFRHIFICICLFATVYSLPNADMEVSKLIPLLKLAQKNDNPNIPSSVDGIIKEEKKNDDVELYDFIKKQYDEFKAKYNKSYDNIEEEENRLAAFIVTLVTVLDHNEKYKRRESGYQMELNHMSDWTPEETRNLHGLIKSTLNVSSEEILSLGMDNNIPSEIDWRMRGAVTPVKSQRLCGSCYSFASTGALEGQIWRKTGKLISLSEQQIVDCDHSEYGCDGGYPTRVFSYIKKVGGLMSESDYPYISGKTKQPNKICKFIKSKAKATDKGFRIIRPDEMEILKAVAQVGPVAVIIHSNDNLKQHGSGIFYDKHCASSPKLHAVLIVGYGTDHSTGMPYWIIKNSWGPNWGEKGYFRMPRNVNACGIKSHAVLPLV